MRSDAFLPRAQRGKSCQQGKNGQEPPEKQVLTPLAPVMGWARRCLIFLHFLLLAPLPRLIFAKSLLLQNNAFRGFACAKLTYNQLARQWLAQQEVAARRAPEARLLRFELDLIKMLTRATLSPLSLLDRGRDRSRARQMVRSRAKLSGYGDHPERQHPYHHDRRESDRQWAGVPFVDHALIVQAVAS
jgi:hypothetical protein